MNYQLWLLWEYLMALFLLLHLHANFFRKFFWSLDKHAYLISCKFTFLSFVISKFFWCREKCSKKLFYSLCIRYGRWAYKTSNNGLSLHFTQIHVGEMCSILVIIFIDVERFGAKCNNNPTSSVTIHFNILNYDWVNR